LASRPIKKGSFGCLFCFAARQVEWTRDFSAVFLISLFTQSSFAEVIMKRRLLAIGSLLFALGMPVSGVAAAAPVSAVDARSIQAVVKSHITALSQDDAEQVFESATSATQVEFGSPEDFLQLIKQEYRPIYQSRHAIFASPEVIDGDTIQVVNVTDDSDHVWVALFRMERDTDGRWKIDGCQLIQTSSVAT
jgi:hypothetical protein